MPLVGAVVLGGAILAVALSMLFGKAEAGHHKTVTQITLIALSLIHI